MAANRVALVADPMWDAENDGAALLQSVHDYLGRFVCYPSPQAHDAHTLWILHTHLMDAWDSTPRLAFLSPEPGSGKSRALEAMEPMVPRPVEAVNVTPAYLFRKVGDKGGRPTILYDEIDTVFGPKAKDNEEIRGLLNAGHRKHSVAGRCVVRGKEVFTEEIPAYCAVALAGLGGLPDTILTRCVIVRMRRRAPDEAVEPYRRRTNGPEAEALGLRCASWAELVRGSIMDPAPELPEGVADRDADVWEPLIAVANAAGGDWPERARVAAVALVADSKRDAGSLGVLLLRDLRRVFGDAEQMTTDAILHGLRAIDESPWDDLRGKPIDSRALSRRLREYGVQPRTIRVGTATPKGYRREELHDAWRRYLPTEGGQADASPVSHMESETSATSATFEADL